MNKLAKRTAAALLSQALLLSAGAMAEEAAELPTAEPEAVETSAPELADEAVAMTINGKDFTVYDFKNAAYYLYSNQYASSPDDYVLAYGFLLQDEMYQYGVAKLGLDQYTEEEEAAFLTGAQTEWDAAVESYIDYYKTGTETEEELAAMKEQANAYWTSMGYSLEYFAQSLKMADTDQRFRDYILATYGLDVTKEDVQAQYDALVEEDKSLFENNAMMYEFYQYYYQYESLYIPTGYRGVLQILLAVDETLLNDYTTKLAAYESQQAAAEATAAPEGEESGEGAEETVPVTLEEVEAARDAALASVQGTIDEIYARLENGESFISLIPEYNIDPGMQDESYLASGYSVHTDSILYDPAFVGAAFDENMNEIGDVSAPVLGKFGVYIVYYLRDAGGPVELNDTLYSSLENDIMSTRLNQKYSELVAEWQSESVITYEAEIFTALTGLEIADGEAVIPGSAEQ